MQCNHRLKLSSPWIPHFAGLYPWTVSQIQPFILYISFASIFYHSNQKCSQYRTRLMTTLWFGAATAVCLWFPEQERPSDLIFCCHWYRTLNVRLFRLHLLCSVLRIMGLSLGQSSDLSTSPQEGNISKCWASEDALSWGGSQGCSKLLFHICPQVASHFFCRTFSNHIKNLLALCAR